MEHGVLFIIAMVSATINLVEIFQVHGDAVNAMPVGDEVLLIVWIIATVKITDLDVILLNVISSRLCARDYIRSYHHVGSFITIVIIENVVGMLAPSYSSSSRTV